MTSQPSKKKNLNPEPTKDDESAIVGANQDLEKAILFAKKYLEDLLSFLGLNTDIYATHEDDVIRLNVPSSRMNGFLIGLHGDNMRAMQFLVGSSLNSLGYQYSRVSVDVAGYKQQRADRLAKTVEDWVAEVKKNKKEMELNPMNAADRRVVHKVADELGLSTESIGDGRDRHVIIKPPKKDK